MEKLENMIGKTYYRPLPKIDGENKIFIVQEVSLVKKRNTYYWGGEQCHPSWLIEDALVYFETKEECQDACYRYEYEAKYVDINSDNIHLYYEFMSDEDLERNEKVIYHKLMNRASLVQLPLSITPKDLQKNAEYKNSILTIFGIKDTLKPIDEYIEEIKNSDAFKEFKRDILIQEANDITNVVIIDFSEDEVAEYIERCIKYLNKRFDSKYVLEIWETDEVYGQRDDEDDYSEEYQGHSMYQGKIAIYDGVFEKDIKFTGIYCEVSAVFSDLLSSLETIEKETISKAS